MKIINSGAHHHRSLRLKGYDYSGEGFYFITICTKDRQYSFGKIAKGEIALNEIGKTAARFLEEVSGHFPHAIVTEQIVMPNHVHLILVLNDKQKFANNPDLTGDATMPGLGPCHGVSPQHNVSPSSNLYGKSVAGSVSVIINQYKASVKRWEVEIFFK